MADTKISALPAVATPSRTAQQIPCNDTSNTTMAATGTDSYLTPAQILGLRGTIASATDGATITFDLSTSDWFTVTLGGNRTLALANPAVGQQFSLILKQDATGSRTISSWFSGILWPGGTTPILTTTANKSDVFTFKCISSGVYMGFTAGQSL